MERHSRPLVGKMKMGQREERRREEEGDCRDGERGIGGHGDKRRWEVCEMGKRGKEESGEGGRGWVSASAPPPAVISTIIKLCVGKGCTPSPDSSLSSSGLFSWSWV